MRGAWWAIIAVAVLAGCGDTNTSSSSGGSGGKKVRIAVIPKGTSHEFWKSVHAGAKAAAEAASAQEIARLKEQNALLTATVDEMKRSNTSLKAELIADFGRLLDRFTDQQETAVSTSIGSAQTLVSRSAAAAETHAAEKSTLLDSLSSATGEVASQLEQSRTSLVEQTGALVKDVTSASG